MRKKTEAKRQAILQVAADVFREMGFDNASMAEIAARVGGSKATLYNYFRSKEEIFVEVMREAALLHYGGEVTPSPILTCKTCSIASKDTQELAERTFEQLRPQPVQPEEIAQTLQRFGEAFMTFISSHEIMTMRRLLVAESGRSEVGRLFYEGGPKRGVTHIAAYLEDLMRQGGLRMADAEIAALQFRALLEAEWFERFLLGVETEMSEARRKDMAERAVAAFLAIYAPVSHAA